MEGKTPPSIEWIHSLPAKAAAFLVGGIVVFGGGILSGVWALSAERTLDHAAFADHTHRIEALEHVDIASRLHDLDMQMREARADIESAARDREALHAQMTRMDREVGVIGETTKQSLDLLRERRR